MQIIRSSRECKWLMDCGCCGCVFVYKGDEVEVKIEKNDIAEVAHSWVKCPECRNELRVPDKAAYRKAVHGNWTDGYEEDCYDL